jgi:hypothetical protein
MAPGEKNQWIISELAGRLYWNWMERIMSLIAGTIFFSTRRCAPNYPNYIVGIFHLCRGSTRQGKHRSRSIARFHAWVVIVAIECYTFCLRKKSRRVIGSCMHVSNLYSEGTCNIYAVCFLTSSVTFDVWKRWVFCFLEDRTQKACVLILLNLLAYFTAKVAFIWKNWRSFRNEVGAQRFVFRPLKALRPPSAEPPCQGQFLLPVPLPSRSAMQSCDQPPPKHKRPSQRNWERIANFHTSTTKQIIYYLLYFSPGPKIALVFFVLSRLPVWIYSGTQNHLVSIWNAWMWCVSSQLIMQREELRDFEFAGSRCTMPVICFHIVLDADLVPLMVEF